MSELAIIGGTGLARMEGMSIERREMVKTPYGAPSSPLVHGRLSGAEVVFLARHGHLQKIPPHRINYQANIWALKAAGVTDVIAVAAVATVDDALPLGAIMVPDQIIDYTNDREYSFCDGDNDDLEFPIDFSNPYDAGLRERLVSAARGLGDVSVEDRGCYGVIQGPRLETAAERNRMRQDGCTVSGMTGMPEAILARELELRYACCALVVRNSGGVVDASAMASVRKVLKAVVGG